MTRLIAVLLIVFTFNLSAQAQLELNGVTLPAQISFNKQSLVLNGGGIRTKLVFKLYTIGLYLPSKSTDGNGLLKADKMIAVRFEITSDMINSENMSEAINEGFEKSTGGNTSALRTKINTLLKAFSNDAITLGDVFDIVYLPGIGTEIYKNGKLKSNIEGQDFKRGLFGIWISDNAISGGLRKELLGL